MRSGQVNRRNREANAPPARSTHQSILENSLCDATIETDSASLLARTKTLRQTLTGI